MNSAAVAGLHPHPRTAVDVLTDEFRQKASIPGALTKPPTAPKQKVYLAEDSTAEEIVCWLRMKGFSCRFAIIIANDVVGCCQRRLLHPFLAT